MNPVRADKVTGYVTALHELKEDNRPRSLKARAGTDFHLMIILRWRARRV